MIAVAGITASTLGYSGNAVAAENTTPEELAQNAPKEKSEEQKAQEQQLADAVGNMIVIADLTLEEAIMAAQHTRKELKLDQISSKEAEQIAVETFNRIEEERKQDEKERQEREEQERQKKEKEKKDKDKPIADADDTPGGWAEKVARSREGGPNKAIS